LVEALSRDEKAELAAQANRFRALPRQERDRLRRLHQLIQDAADAQQLQQNLIAYGQWFSQLTLGEQEELKEALRGLPPDKQIDQLRQFIRQENRRDARQLSAEDSEKLRRAVLAIVEERRAALSHELQKRGASERARGLQGPRGTLMVLYWILQNEEASSEARERIVEALSPDARAHLEKLSRGGRRAQLWQWVRDSLRPKWGAGELEQFFIHELDNDQRERLLNLPPGEMQAELERLYVASELGFRGMVEPGDWPWHPPVPNRPPPRRDMGERGRRDGPPPPEFRDRQRFERGPQGPPPGPRDRNRREKRPPPPGPPPPDTRQNPI
jgi:hypothetical protein